MKKEDLHKILFDFMVQLRDWSHIDAVNDYYEDDFVETIEDYLTDRSIEDNALAIKYQVSTRVSLN